MLSISGFELMAIGILLRISGLTATVRTLENAGMAFLIEPGLLFSPANLTKAVYVPSLVHLGSKSVLSVSEYGMFVFVVDKAYRLFVATIDLCCFLLNLYGFWG